MISIDDLELAAAASWRAVEEERLGDWLLRAADGFTGRANSALAAGDPGRPAAAAVDAVRGWYAARGLPAMIAIPYPTGRPGDSGLDRMLAGLGWVIRAGAATVMTAEPAAALRAGGPGLEVGVAVDLAPDQAWLDRYHYRGQDLPPIARRLLTSAPWQAFASVRAGGETIAIGRVAGGGDWAGLTAIEVDPARRRERLGTAVTAALAGFAAERGARGLFLQVTDDNHAARALYQNLGFTDHHGYHYRIAPR
ncbi:MAG TPA: GNAT family N-acetyltransferase [Streptosporangiaceae bacterium]|nr:GNAT family N-acetyltransferase [Streptosporangiaceae bacterium]